MKDVHNDWQREMTCGRGLRFCLLIHVYAHLQYKKIIRNSTCYTDLGLLSPPPCESRHWAILPDLHHGSSDSEERDGFSESPTFAATDSDWGGFDSLGVLQTVEGTINPCPLPCWIQWTSRYTYCRHWILPLHKSHFRGEAFPTLKVMQLMETVYGGFSV